jgi:YidC/Oxa1 family membrane protein insertase
MDQEKRVMIAVGLSFLMLIVWRFAFPPPPEPKKPVAVQPVARVVPPVPAAQTKGPAKSPHASAAPRPAGLPVLTGGKAEDVVVESDLYRVTFSTQGAAVKSWVLKKYRDAKDEPLDVVNGPACEALGYPMKLSLANRDLADKLNAAIYVPTPSGPSLQAPAKIEFTYSDGTVRAKKQFNFGPAYEARVEMSVFDGSSGEFLPLEVAWPGGFGDHSLPPAIEDAFSQVVYGSPDNLTTVALKKVKEDQPIPGPLDIVGLEDKYFAGIILPGPPDQTFRYGRRVWTPADWKGKDSDKPQALFALLGSAQPKPLAFRIFAGPKDRNDLRSVNPPLDSLVNFGFFKWFAEPLFLALHYIHDHVVGNYGWAIVILTVLINLAMFPLKLKSIKSAQEMQRIAPLVKDIQDKYKQYKFNDPRKQRMNQEVMKLYQEHHINPLGGCLPMALQMPFLYGFYRVLDLPIELRHAPWMGWIKDLSAADPLYILPIIMVVTMFILQKMTPVATTDPGQQRMMMLMPLFFGIMFFRFASGLVLYFMVANLVGIAQQVIINKKISPPRPLAVPPKAGAAKD